MIFSDSLSALSLLVSSSYSYFSLKYKILSYLFDFRVSGLKVVIQWVPSHCGIPGNEKADALAKEALNLDMRTDLTPCYKDVKNRLFKNFKTNLNNNWQLDKRVSYLGNHLPSLSDVLNIKFPNRGTQVAYTRLRLGHTRLAAHLFRFNIVDSPNCRFCGIPEDVQHMFFTCARLYSFRCRLFADIYRLGIARAVVDEHVLLGGGDFDREIKSAIANIVVQFLHYSNKYKDI